MHVGKDDLDVGTEDEAARLRRLEDAREDCGQSQEATQSTRSSCPIQGTASRPHRRSSSPMLIMVFVTPSIVLLLCDIR